MPAKMRYRLTLFALSIFFCIFHPMSFASAQAPVPNAQIRTVEENRSLRSLSVRVTGSMCAACLKRLKERLLQIDGVHDVEVSPRATKPVVPSLKAEIHPKKRQALITLRFETDKTPVSHIIESIRQMDFKVLSVRRHKHEKVKT